MIITIIPFTIIVAIKNQPSFNLIIINSTVFILLISFQAIIKYLFSNLQFLFQLPSYYCFHLFIVSLILIITVVVINCYWFNRFIRESIIRLVAIITITINIVTIAIIVILEYLLWEVPKVLSIILIINYFINFNLECYLHFNFIIVINNLIIIIIFNLIPISTVIIITGSAVATTTTINLVVHYFIYFTDFTGYLINFIIINLI